MTTERNEKYQLCVCKVIAAKQQKNEQRVDYRRLNRYDVGNIMSVNKHIAPLKVGGDKI